MKGAILLVVRTSKVRIVTIPAIGADNSGGHQCSGCFHPALDANNGAGTRLTAVRAATMAPEPLRPVDVRSLAAEANSS